MDPAACVRVIHDEGKGGGSRRRARPREGRGEVRAVACKLDWDGAALGKAGARQYETGHLSLLRCGGGWGRRAAAAGTGRQEQGSRQQGGSDQVRQATRLTGKASADEASGSRPAGNYVWRGNCGEPAKAPRSVSAPALFPAAVAFAGLAVGGGVADGLAETLVLLPAHRSRLLGRLVSEPAVCLGAGLVEPPGLDLRQYGATRFESVRAIGEPAPLSHLDDLVEGLVYAFVRIPHSKLAHARRIEHERAVRQEEQLPVGGRMTAASVILAGLARHHQLLAGERVEQRRLADTRRSHER